MDLIDKNIAIKNLENEIKLIYAGREYVGIPSHQEHEVIGIERAIEILKELETIKN